MDAPTKKALKRMSITLGALLIACSIGTGVVIGGVIAGLLVFAALYTVLTVVPGAKQLLEKAGSMADVIVTVGTIVLSGGTVTGFVAGATVGCLFTVVVSLKKLPSVTEWFDQSIAKTEASLKRHRGEAGPGENPAAPSQSG